MTVARKAHKRRLAAAALVLGMSMWSAVSVVAKTLNVRTGDHPTFSRVVFDWTEAVEYDVQITDDKLIISFDKVAEPKFDSIVSYPLTYLSSPAIMNNEGRLQVSFTIPEGSTQRHFETDFKVVVDISKMQLSTVESDVPPPQVLKNARSEALAKPAEPLPPVAAGKEPAQSSLTTIVVEAEPLASGLRLEYPMKNVVGAAAFLRDGFLWVVFDAADQTFDHRNVEVLPGGRIKNVEDVPNATASVIRYRVRAGQSLFLRRAGANWQIDLKDTLTSPALPVEIGLQADEDTGRDRIFMPVTEVGSRVEIVDPAVGDRLVVVPVLAAGRGIQTARQFVDFNVLESAQGVAVQIKSDGVSVNRYRNGIVIDAIEGLALSRSTLAQSFQTQPEELLEQAGSEMAGGSDTPSRIRLIDLDAWRLGPREKFTDNLQKILLRLSLATGTERNAARWELARYYLGFGMGVDARGYLALMAEADPSLLENVEYLAVRGVANIMSRRYREALNDLEHTSLKDVPDAALWRTLANENLGKWDAALADYMKGADVLSLYSQLDRADFQLAAVRAAHEQGNAELMARELDILSNYVLPPDRTSEIQYQKGQMYNLAGDVASAMTAYKAVVDGGQRRTSALAKLALTNLQLEDSLISVTDAIDRLERLRFSWRGDAFELALLDKLGRLYFEAEDYRTGFETLRQAITYFGQTPESREISKVMVEVFKGLYLEGGADSMAPVSALALYYDFRELTPLGAEGDNMIRRLADRLVSVDLLDRAAELLEHQVKFRLEGVARATVATRLAMIYLMDSKPEKALEIIRATRQAVMPDDVNDMRRKVEARALTDIKQYEEALVLLEGDKSREAELLRADIYWGAGDWGNVVGIGNKLLGKRWESTDPLSADERRQVLRMALAMSLADDRSGLKTLREQYLQPMEGGSYENAFNVITSRQERTTTELQALTRDIAGVNTLEGFMESYREEFNSTK